ncbi:BREX-1 system adenine-specific DNA-methyltransferase PglX [Paenibacillus taichungensis]|uniref:BREX-1 system adenine-specific DNA-methyltransferase PglX n=1 Tax=Paenibacillus taichungensis TaxID=484184 RepID=UPI0039A38F26
MNKTELKNYAMRSRRQLIDQVKTKALMYGIDEKNDLDIKEQFGQLMINNKPYPLYMKSAFSSLKNQLKQKGYKQLVEEIAYTWFNRIIAIRYMEVHDYLPEKVNVLSSSIGRIDPDIIFEYETMDLPVKKEEIRELLYAGDTEGAFRKLLIAQCNALNNILPFLFEQIQDYTELLLPDFLLDAESVIKVLVQNDELTNSFEEIEVIGWLYQYYIAEEKERVFGQKSKYIKEEIPFATQLFTPKWIVQYMVQNSLGRYWTEAHREDEDLISKWEYFTKHEEEDFYEKIASYVNKELRVEDIKLLDPAMGSGHILVYAFEVFYQIYEKCGYPEREIPRLIIENNLYGLDIDDRAYQLAAFAVVMTAASYSRRFLRSVERAGIQLNLASIQETNHISDSVIAYIAQEEDGERYNQIKAIFDQFYNAKTYGSLINIIERDITFIEERLEHIQNNPVEDLFFAEQHDIAKEVIPNLIQQTKIMRNEYDVVVMNPPYMGLGSMIKDLSEFLKKYYPNSKSDLFAAFMEIDSYLKKNGMYAAINQHSWMFLSSFEKLREKIILNKFIDTMLHLGPRAFEEIGGEVVQSTAFVMRNSLLKNFKGIYLRVTDERTAQEKRVKLMTSVVNPSVPYRYLFNQDYFRKITGFIIAYWISDRVVEIFESQKPLSNFFDLKVGVQTGDNDNFIKYWYEVDIKGLFESDKWIYCNKGGEFRKWYGNLSRVIYWKNDGFDIKNHKSAVIRNEEYFFRPSITWSNVSSGNLSLRFVPEGLIFDQTGPSIFDKNDNLENIKVLMGYLNSEVVSVISKMLSPTLHFNVGELSNYPFIEVSNNKHIINLVNENIIISKTEWDSYETSWDFNRHPLLKFSAKKLESAFSKWQEFTESQFNQLNSNEENLNRFFIEIYGLQDELTPEIEEKDVALRKANLIQDVKSFLSYFIGCFFGRYSLNAEGLKYDSDDLDELKYKRFIPSQLGVIQLTNVQYFEQDIINFLREFLAVAFSPDIVDENIQWLAEGLEMKKGEDAEARLRRYFLDEFFADHCKMYQKRPIYWLVDSGKQKGLRTLIYMHRYQPDTMATIRFDHLQEIQAKYQNEITDLENRLVNPNFSASEKKKLIAEKTSFEKKMDELREFDKRLAEIANEEIEIDLDDGVKVNYEKFYRGGKGVLAKIK